MAKKRNIKMQEFPKKKTGVYEMSKGMGRSEGDINEIFKEYRETGKLDEKRWARI